MPMATAQERERRTRAFTAGEVDRMVAAGILGEDEPVALIDGDLVLVSPQSPEHQWVIEQLAERLRARLPEQVRVSEEKPLSLGPGALTIPEPDLAVVPRRQAPGRAQAHEALLVVEVGVTSASDDRGGKARMYAEAGVAELWLIDVGARTCEVLGDPRTDGVYASQRTLSAEEHLVLPLRGGELRLAEVLPPTQ